MKAKYTKPRGSVISLSKAKTLAAAWHGGQWSPLYSFASSYERQKNWVFASQIDEVDITLNGRGAKYLSAKDKKDLNDLRKFFQYKAWESEQEFKKSLKK
jgi:hypothetical protein